MQAFPRKGAWCVIATGAKGSEIDGALGILNTIDGETAEVHLVHTETKRNQVHGETAETLVDLPLSSVRIATFDEIEAVCKARRSPLTRKKAAAMGYV